jgi:hypothetical protein
VGPGARMISGLSTVADSTPRGGVIRARASA